MIHITPIQFKHIGSVTHFTFQRKHIAIKAFSNIVYHQPSESRHDTIRIPLRRKVIKILHILVLPFLFQEVQYPPASVPAHR